MSNSARVTPTQVADPFAAAFPMEQIDNGQNLLDSFDLHISQLEDGEFAGDDPAIVGMVAAEDAQFALEFKDLRDDPLNSAKEKEKNALKHLNYFLKHYATQRGESHIKAEELEFEATDENIAWWDDMIGCFFTYLAKNARRYCDPDKDRVAYNTATGYASSIKAYYSNKFRTQKDEIPIFKDSRWKGLRAGLLSHYEEDNRLSGKSLINPHQASSNEDCEAIATGCIWLNNPKAAEFYHLNVTMKQYCGRGSEVALDRRSRIRPVLVTELHFEYHIIEDRLKRHKNKTESLLQLYPHRKSFLQCIYFSLFYRIVMLGDDGDYIFPEFANKAANQSESKSDSKVSSLWSSYFSDIYQSFVCLSHKLNTKLTSHCHKKGASQLMAETPAVSGLAQIFRTGWEVRGFHSIFDYIVGSTVMQQQAGKAISGWTAKIGDTTVGGQPPSLRDIHTSPDLLEPFVAHVFIHDTSNGWHPTIRELLVASMLRHYDDFCALLQQEPENRFERVEDHFFVATIQDKLQASGVDGATFEAWKKEVRIGFFNKNLPALAIQDFPRHLGDTANPFHQIMMDPRCFVDHFNSLAAHYMGLHSQVCQQQTSIGNLTAMVNGMQVQLQRQNELIREMATSLQNRPAVVPVSPSDTSSPPLSPRRSSRKSRPSPSSTPTKPFIKRFSVAFQTLTKGCTIADRFVFFFAERARAGYDEDKALDMDATETKKVRNDFTRLKRTVRLMLLFCDAFPSEKPNDPTELASWLAALREMATQAEATMRSLLYPDNPNKVMTQSALTGKAISMVTKEWEDGTSEFQRQLPDNTPNETKSWFLMTDKVSGKKRKRNNNHSEQLQY